MKINECKQKHKQHIIAKLRKDLKSACFVALSLKVDKKREISAMSRHLAYARGECVHLLERYDNNISININLFKKNVKLNGRLENLSNLINLGYEELKKIKVDETNETTTLAQLKKVIESCGQYYADYCNEIQISSEIRQRNHFLKNKIIVLENNIEAIKKQLKVLEYQIMRLKIDNEKISVSSSCCNLKVCSKENHKTSFDKNYQDLVDSVQDQKGFDLSTHLAIVNRLLTDQDSLLKNLNVITRELSF